MWTLAAGISETNTFSGSPMWFCPCVSGTTAPTFVATTTSVRVGVLHHFLKLSMQVTHSGMARGVDPLPVVS